jgi:ATP-binding cassette subfamily B protein
MKFLVDTATRQEISLAIIGAVGMAVSLGLPWLASGITLRACIRLEERVGFTLERRLAELSATLPGIEHQERPDYLDKLYLVQKQQGTLGSAVGAVILLIGALVQAVTVLTLLGSVNPLLLLLPILSIPTLFADQAWQHALGKAEEESAETERMASHLETLATTATSAKELQVFGLQREIIHRHKRALLDAHSRKARGQVSGMIWTSGAWILFALGFAGAVTLVVWRASRGLASAGDVMLTISLAGLARISISNVIRTVSRAKRLLCTAERLLWLMDYSSNISFRQASAQVPSRIRESITCEYISFRYPGTTSLTLKEISLQIPAGSVIALVGENGAGKTTLVKLLCGFYEPEAGRILVDGVDVGEFDLCEWRSRISGAFQDAYRFELDAYRFELLVREAVGIGYLPKIENAEAVASALKRAGAESILQQVPNGLYTQLGLTWEDGVELSVGQWQQLALGRALMREQPLLLVLDEPTAPLDAATEYALFEQMTRAARACQESGAITLLVSHSFSTVRMADRIIVLSEGRVVEEGSHNDLMAQHGVYAELYTLQAQSYKETIPGRVQD